MLFTILLFSGIGSATVGAHAPRPAAIAMRATALLVTLIAAGLLPPAGDDLGAIRSNRYALCRREVDKH